MIGWVACIMTWSVVDQDCEVPGLTNRAVVDAGWQHDMGYFGSRFAEVGGSRVRVLDVPGSSGTRGDFRFPTGPAYFGREVRDGEELKAPIFS
jgi:hypothetical protein